MTFLSYWGLLSQDRDFSLSLPQATRDVNGAAPGRTATAQTFLSLFFPAGDPQQAGNMGDT
jgi:hypothetical protein